MNILLVAGGSGGHIYPCLSLAKYLISRNVKVIVSGANNSMEEKIYKENNLNFIGLDINKNKVKSLIKNYKNIKKIYDENKIDKVILFGNYISFSFAIVAKRDSIPIYLHEQNVIYGRANKLIGMMAKRIYLSFPIKHDLYKKKSLLVGNPKSDNIIKRKIYLDKTKKNVLIVMGSLGSTTINNMLKELVKIANPNLNYHIITGKKYYDNFINETSFKTNIFIYPYLNDLASYMSNCDLFVSRSGATTLSEIIQLNVASILIPSPYVKDNHQYKNAKYLLDNDAIILMDEKKINAHSLNEMIIKIISDDLKLNKLRNNTKKLMKNDICKMIYEDLIHG